MPDLKHNAPNANEELVLARIQIAVLESTLQRWCCPSCGGMKVYRQRSSSGSEEVPCKVCEATGLHPTAREGLAQAVPDQPRNDDFAKDRVALVERLITEGGEDQVTDAFARGVIAAFGHGQAVAWNRAAQRRTCRVCGCWELEACGGGCWWVDENLCSTCEIDDGEIPY